jgi:hypothetical protein
VEDPHLSLDEPFKSKEKLSKLARSEYPTHLLRHRSNPPGG